MEYSIWQTKNQHRKLPTDIKGGNIGEISDFCSDAINFFTKIFEKYPKKANRLALVTTCLLEEMSNSEFNRIYQILFNSPSFYADNKPVEWGWNVVSRIERPIADLLENLNVISILKRLSGELEAKTERLPFQRILLQQDINTIPDSTEARFDLCHIPEFFSTAKTLHDDLETSILSFINV